MLYYIEADALGTPRVVIDPDRNVAVWRWDLAGEAFGDSIPVEDADGDGVAFVFDMRFPGQRFDSATGFNDNYFRDYDPSTGRYAQSDPIGLAGGVSTYAYVGGDPFGSYDPLGLQSRDEPGRRRPTIPAPWYLTIDTSVGRDVGRLLDRVFEKDDLREKTYQTYTRYNPFTGKCYSGRTSGYGTPEQNVRIRGLKQVHLTADGFNMPILDKSSENYDAIRGREQQLIEINGGAQSVGGTSRNLINGISMYNIYRGKFLDAATVEFGVPVKKDMLKCQCM